MTSETLASVRPARPWLWGGLWLGSIAAVAGLHASGAIEPPLGYILFALTMGLLIPFTRAMRRLQSDRSRGGLAALRYTTGMVMASLGYVLGLGIAIAVHDRTGAEGGLAVFLAMLPVIPIFYMIFIMGRYLMEESDEYLRYRTVIASLAGLGLVLGLGSFWGFLETFEVVPHAPGWWAMPVWALGMGMAQCWMAFRDRTPAEEQP